MIFHIDENAYHKLQNYLNAVKRSFAGASGEDEIIADIENRIAELFSEKMVNDRQVIGLKEVDEVITIMGQPEDYMVDEDIFEDAPKSSSAKSKSRSLFRDPDNKYIGGVAAGLGHYLNLDPLVSRIIWVALAFITGGGVLLAYVILWALIPEAKSTADKIAMMGDPINISNIEKKIKEGIDSATETVKSVDYDKYSSRAQSGISTFFDKLGKILVTLLGALGKFIGIILIFVSIITLISMIVGLFTVGSIGFFGVNIYDQLEIYDHVTTYPVWLISLLVFFAAGIPLFFLSYLGIKILLPQSKSIGTIAKLSLTGVWLLSVIGLAVISIGTAFKSNHEANAVIKEELMVTPQDTLYIEMRTNELFPSYMRRSGNEQFVYNENDEKFIFAQDVRLIVKSTRDSIGSIRIKKYAKGSDHEIARKRAADITYNYELEGNTLWLDNYLLASPDMKYNDQEVEITLYLPEGIIINADENTYYYHQNSRGYGDILDNDYEGYYLKVLNNKTECLNCPERSVYYEEGDEGRVIIDKNGLNITIKDGDNDEDSKIIIDENGIDVDIKDKDENFEMKINEDGVHVKKDDN